jgi:hypothetical protein
MAKAPLACLCLCAAILVALLLFTNTNERFPSSGQQSTNAKSRVPPPSQVFNDKSDPVEWAKTGNILFYQPIDPNLMQLAGTGRAY